jgi:hypothetical protein
MPAPCARWTPPPTIVGPEEWGWLALFYSGFDQQNGTGPGSDYAAHNNTYYYPWLMQQLASYQQTTGKQLLDVLSVHYYPQDGSFSDNDSLSAQLIRNQSTRSLWDPNYVDQSWIATVGIDNGIVDLIPNLKSWVKQYYPGLKTAITEYNWGDEPNLNGATTQADVLGIFGRQALDMGTRWTVPVNPSPTYLSMQIYRNYDGNNSTFGNTSVYAGVADPDYLSSFAAVRSTDNALTVMVDQQAAGQHAGVRQPGELRDYRHGAGLADRLGHPNRDYAARQRRHRQQFDYGDPPVAKHHPVCDPGGQCDFAAVGAYRPGGDGWERHCASDMAGRPAERPATPSAAEPRSVRIRKWVPSPARRPPVSKIPA